MVTSIQLGNFFSSGGKTVLGGVGGSGLDTEGLIKGLTEAKRLPAVKLEDTVKTNEAKTTALNEFKTIMSTLKDSVNFLRNPPGVGNAAENAFAYTSANVISNTSTLAGNYLSVNTSPGVAPQTFNISEISSVAAAKQQSTPNLTIADADTAFVTASPTAERFTAGNLVINGAGGDVTITLATGDTLNQVATKFNTVSDDTGIKASVIKVSDGEYRLVFTATSTGTDADFDFNTDGGAAGGTIDGSEAVFNSLVFSNDQLASDAVFTLNNIEITRQNNSVSDVVSGVTFTLFQETPALTEITATISADNSIAKNGIINFINAYNELRVFAAKQLEAGNDGKYVEGAVLANNATFRNTVSTITTTLTQIVSGITGTQLLNGSTVTDPSRLSELGITFTDLPKSAETPLVRNILTLDEGKLDAALSLDFEAVRKVFEFDLTSTNSNVREFSRTNALAVSNFSVNFVAPVAATAKIQSSPDITIADADTAFVTAVATPGVFTAGTININTSGADVPITLADGDTLNQVVTKFNAVSASTKISASVATVSPGVFKLVFTSTVAGTAGDFSFNTDGGDAGGTIDGDESVFNGFVFTNTQAAANAIALAATATYNNGSGPVTIDLDATAIIDNTDDSTVGYTLKGQNGTVLEGLQLIYASTSAATFDVVATQGLADKVFNISDDVLDTQSGTLKNELESIKTADERLADEIAKIDEFIARYRQQLLDKFAALEQAIARVNNLLQSLDAQANARNNS